MKTMLKDTLIIFIITLIAGLALGVVYQITKDPIAKQKDKAKQEACLEVFTDAASFDDEAVADNAVDILTSAGYTAQSIDSVMKALDASGNTIGYVLTVTTKEGYNGDISFTMGITLDGNLNGISILSISETAGLGMRAEEVLKPQFVNKNVEQFTYTKMGSVADSEIDAISGATITTNAVVNGVNSGLCYFGEVLKGGN